MQKIKIFMEIMMSAVLTFYSQSNKVQELAVYKQKNSRKSTFL